MNGQMIEALTEFVPLKLPDSKEHAQLARAICDRYAKQIAVEWSSPVSPFLSLCNVGYAGALRVGDSTLHLSTKVPVNQIFRMLEYAYQLFDVEDELVRVRKIEDVFESLADVLAQGVLAQAARGLFREYVDREDTLACLRGRIQVAASIRRTAKGDTRLHCRFHEHTPDVWENQLLLVTLERLRSFSFSRVEVERKVHAAYRALALKMEARPEVAEDFLNRPYHRLNLEYRKLHALCRLFLKNLGPQLEEGPQPFLPYLIRMWELFEEFVAAWLAERLAASGSGIQLKSQDRFPVDRQGKIVFEPDLVLTRSSGQVLAVADTKYKRVERPSTSDVQQILAYAGHLGAPLAILIYPSTETSFLTFHSGGIEARVCRFDLSRDLAAAGEDFLSETRLLDV